MLSVPRGRSGRAATSARRSSSRSRVPTARQVGLPPGPVLLEQLVGLQLVRLRLQARQLVELAGALGPHRGAELQPGDDVLGDPFASRSRRAPPAPRGRPPSRRWRAPPPRRPGPPGPEAAGRRRSLSRQAGAIPGSPGREERVAVGRAGHVAAGRPPYRLLRAGQHVAVDRRRHRLQALHREEGAEERLEELDDPAGTLRRAEQAADERPAPAPGQKARIPAAAAAASDVCRIINVSPPRPTPSTAPAPRARATGPAGRGRPPPAAGPCRRRSGRPPRAPTA